MIGRHRKYRGSAEEHARWIDGSNSTKKDGIQNAVNSADRRPTGVLWASCNAIQVIRTDSGLACTEINILQSDATQTVPC